MSKYIKVYDRNLTLSQIAQIISEVDDDMLLDIARSIEEYDNVKEILITLDGHTDDKKALNKLYQKFGISYSELFHNVSHETSSKKKNQKKKESPVDYGINQTVDNFAEAESPKIQIGKDYETDRKERVLCPITEIPDVDFHMPKMPEINK